MYRRKLKLFTVPRGWRAASAVVYYESSHQRHPYPGAATRIAMEPVVMGVHGEPWFKELNTEQAAGIANGNPRSFMNGAAVLGSAALL